MNKCVEIRWRFEGVTHQHIFHYEDLIDDEMRENGNYCIARYEDIHKGVPIMVEFSWQVDRDMQKIAKIEGDRFPLDAYMEYKVFFWDKNVGSGSRYDDNLCVNCKIVRGYRVLNSFYPNKD